MNKLDHIKATREFYKEIRSKCAEEEELGPIVNEEGKLSTTLKECLENWKNYYEKLYSAQGKSKKEEEGEEKEEEMESEEWEDEQPKERNEQEAEIDREITIEEVVEAAFALKSNKAAGCDTILSNDIIELLCTNKKSENWQTEKILEFLHRE